MLNKFLSNSEKDKYYFYYKDKSRKISPVLDIELNLKAKEKLNFILKEYSEKIPIEFKNNWNEVKLFDTKGSVDKAHSLILNETEGAYDLKNSLNHLTGKEWTKFTCSWFIFNALAKDLKEERAISNDLEHHPATYSPTMMENFIKFFTKENMKVLDPFMGIGSTLVGCKRTGRIGYGIELNKKYYELVLKRIPEFKNNIVHGDSRNVKKFFSKEKFNLCISSPPYWDVLNRSTGDFKKNRDNKGFDVKYSELDNDLGNLKNYENFILETSNIYLDIYDLLEKNSYLIVIVKNVKKEGKLYPIAWDLAKELSKKYSLKDEKIWIQDKIGLSPYGYPHVWTSNILHHYCLIFKKD